MTLPAHSKLGASQAHRWMACPASVAAADGLQPSASSYAAEGTVAHTIAAKCLEDGSNPHDWIGKLVEQEGHSIIVTEDMTSAVEVYVDLVRQEALVAHLPYSTLPDCVLIEHRFHLKDIHPDLFGTADCVIFFPGESLLRVYDYKHGAGVAVEVEDNPQLKYYALGALFSSEHPIKTVEMVVVQPRCDHPAGPVRRARIDALDLIDWSADLLDAVRRTEDENAQFHAGSHCRWCPAAGVCSELAAHAQSLARTEFSNALSYDPQVLSKTLESFPVLEAWINQVREFAYGEALHGRTPPGFKLVEKRPRRKWASENEAELFLQDELGLGSGLIHEPPRLKSPAQMEKMLGRDAKELLEAFIVKESSGHALVPESDPRAAVRADPASDFAAA